MRVGGVRSVLGRKKGRGGCTLLVMRWDSGYGMAELPQLVVQRVEGQLRRLRTHHTLGCGFPGSILASWRSRKHGRECSVLSISCFTSHLAGRSKGGSGSRQSESRSGVRVCLCMCILRTQSVALHAACHLFLETI